MKKTVGKYTKKRYECSKCGYVKIIGTNHYGQCYSMWGSYNACPKCRPVYGSTVWNCVEPLPEGWDRPPNWKQTTLGEIGDFKIADSEQ